MNENIGAALKIELNSPFPICLQEFMLQFEEINCIFGFLETRIECIAEAVLGVLGQETIAAFNEIVTELTEGE